MKNVIALVVVIVLLGGYYVKNKDTVNTWFNEASQKTGINLDTITSGQALTLLQQQVENTISQQTIQDQIGNWVDTNGIKLPNGWQVGQKKISNKHYPTIMPPTPLSANDYIILNYPADKAGNLPEPHTCAQENAVTRCLVGNNLETMKTFVLMSFVK